MENKKIENALETSKTPYQTPMEKMHLYITINLDILEVGKDKVNPLTGKLPWVIWQDSGIMVNGNVNDNMKGNDVSVASTLARAYKQLTPDFYFFIKTKIIELQRMYEAGILRTPPLMQQYALWKKQWSKIYRWAKMNWGDKMANCNTTETLIEIAYGSIKQGIIGDSRGNNISCSFTSFTSFTPLSMLDNFPTMTTPLYRVIVNNMKGGTPEAMATNFVFFVKQLYPEYFFNGVICGMFTFTLFKDFCNMLWGKPMDELTETDRKLLLATYTLISSQVKSELEAAGTFDSLNSFAEDTKERAGVNIGEDFAA